MEDLKEIKESIDILLERTKDLSNLYTAVSKIKEDINCQM